MYRSSGPMVSSMLCLRPGLLLPVNCCYVGLYICADSKMKLLKESVALDSISGKEYDVGILSALFSV